MQISDLIYLSNKCCNFRISDKILTEHTKPIFNLLLLRSGEPNQVTFIVCEADLYILMLYVS